MEKLNLISPAFPPQVAQDQFGRFIAPIPGMTKLEYFAIQLLPAYLQIGLSSAMIGVDGQKLTAYQAAVQAAELLLNELEKQQKQSAEEAPLINLNND